MAAGKSTVAKILVQRGFPVCDADEINHEFLDPKKLGSIAVGEIVQTFGQGVLGLDGTVDRSLLAKAVFGTSKLQDLEKILHPKIRAEVQRRRSQWASEGRALAFYDVPLLFEKNMERDFDGVLVVTTSPEIQFSRLKERNSWTDAEIAKRLSHQLPLQEKERRGTWVIRNNGTRTELEREVDRALALIQSAP